jgi:UDP-N-acetylmuramoylalanine--D-glutamate ligase
MDLAGKKALVLGLGETGLSMARWLVREGADVRVADTRAVPPGLAQLRQALPAVGVHCGGFADACFDGINLIAISPGVPLAEPAVAQARARGVTVVGDIELFAQALLRDRKSGAQALPQEAGTRLLAITGTNGKSTVTALAGAMCKSAGLDCEIAGNISPAVLDALLHRRKTGRNPDAWVLELSSFQLETTESLDASAATMLNFSEDHLDRYVSMRDYAAAKARVFRGSGVQILNRDDPCSSSMALPGRSTITFGLGAPAAPVDFGLIEHRGSLWLAQGTTPLLAMAEIKLAGLHNVANALAALALCRAIELPFAPLFSALLAFRGLPHRVELVGERGGVRFYDDSKGTNVGSTAAALAGLAGGTLAQGAKVVLIAGGDGKSQDFSPLKSAVAKTAREVVLIGRDAPLIERALDGSGVPVHRAASMDEAVAVAGALAQPGDAVLLSPACASYDMFRNYVHRGEVFRAAVEGWVDATAH